MPILKRTLPDDGGWYVTDDIDGVPTKYERRDAARYTKKIHSGWVIVKNGAWERGTRGRVRVFKTFNAACTAIERIEGI